MDDGTIAYQGEKDGLMARKSLTFQNRNQNRNRNRDLDFRKYFRGFGVR